MLNTMRKLLNKNLFCFGLFLFAIVLSVWLKNDNTYDFKNYHYYNAFAFLNGRLNYDIVPAYINTFFNPLIELPLFFYIQWFNCHLNIIMALQGIWFGILLVAVFKIAELFMDFSKKSSWLYFLYTLFIITTSCTVLPQIGSSTNEIMIASVGIWGMYILLYMFKYTDKQKGMMYFFSGVIIGMAVGLKQTFVCMALASGIMLCVSFKNLKHPIKYITLFALGGMFGGILTCGFMLWKYWNLYGNPFFPFLNGIFQSPYMEALNYRDDTSKPKLISYFLSPYIWFVSPKYQPNGFRGFAVLVYYSFSFGLFFYLLFMRKLSVFYKKEKALFALLCFLLTYFYIWFILFSIYRYAVIYEVLSAILLVAFICGNNRINQHKNLLLFILFFFLWYPNPWEFNDYREKKDHKCYIETEKVVLPDNTLLQVFGIQNSYMIAELAKNNTIRALGYYPKCEEGKFCHFGRGADIAEHGKFFEIRKEVEEKHVGAKVVLYSTFFNTPESIKFKMSEDGKKLHRRCVHFRSIGKLNGVNCDYLYHDYSENDIKMLTLINDMYCKELDSNLNGKGNSSIFICVPPELKQQILPED